MSYLVPLKITGFVFALLCLMIVIGCQESLPDNGKTPRKEAVEILAALASSDEETNINAARKILSHEVKFGASEAALVPQMVALLKREDSDIQLAVLGLLATMGKDASEALPAIRKCLNSRDEMVRGYAEETIEYIEHPEARDRDENIQSVPPSRFEIRD